MAVSEPEPRQIIDLAQLVELQRKCDEVLVDRSVLRYAVDLVHATRDPEAHQLADLAPLLAIGASPRATLGLIRAAKALAAMRGRSYASPQDVFEVAPEILRHRLVLTYDALAREVSVEHVLQRLMATVPAAWVHPGRAGPGAPRSRHRPLMVRASFDGACAAPAVAGAPDAHLAEILRSLELRVDRKLDGILHGQHQGLTPGHGSEHGESRPYSRRRRRQADRLERHGAHAGTARARTDRRS